jgi:hypothetical protein
MTTMTTTMKDAARRNNVTINLPTEDERHRLTRGGGDKRSCSLTTGGGGNEWHRLSMGGRDDKRRRLR